MRKKIFVVILVLIMLFTAACFSSCNKKKKLKISTPSENTINLENMTLVFEDQFDKDTIDDTVWSSWFDTHIRRGGYWHKDQCFTQDGNLIIRTEYKENGEHGAGWYTGMIRSRNLKEFTYGYFEVRCKVPAAQGLWSAFWMQNDNMLTEETAKGKNGAEIDIMESPYYYDPMLDEPLKYRNTTMHTIHIDGYGKKYDCRLSDQYIVQNDMYEEFNTYGLHWTDKEYIFYVNGHETWRTTFGVAHVPEYLWLSVEIAGDMKSADPANPNNKFAFSGELLNNDLSIFPVDFVVDYVRVYQSK